MLSEHKDWREPEHWDPPEGIEGLLIGVDADGNKYVLDPAGHVKLVPNFEYEAEVADLAPSFAAFMENYLFGRGYAERYLSNGYQNMWSDIVVSEGWGRS